MKISDFGLTREGTVYQMDPTKRVPIRWLAPETLRTAIYTQKTDIFSYGILCWEIFADGMEPYPGLTVAEVNIKVMIKNAFFYLFSIYLSIFYFTPQC